MPVKWNNEATDLVADAVYDRIYRAVDLGRVVLQQGVNVQTGSLRYTVGVEMPKRAVVKKALRRGSLDSQVVASVRYGGQDLSNKTIPLTGRRGKRVTYARPQERRTRALMQAMLFAAKPSYDSG